MRVHLALVCSMFQVFIDVSQGASIKTNQKQINTIAHASNKNDIIKHESDVGCKSCCIKPENLYDRFLELHKKDMVGLAGSYHHVTGPDGKPVEAFVPWPLQTNLRADFSGKNLTTVKNQDQSSPDVEDRATCMWTTEVDCDPTRIPSTIVVAKCIQENEDCYARDNMIFGCEGITYEMPVLRISECEKGLYKYHSSTFKVTIGYTCAFRHVNS